MPGASVREADGGAGAGPLQGAAPSAAGSASPSSSVPTSGVVYGAAALALGAAASAVALERLRKREEELARQRAEMAQANAAAERADVEWRAMLGAMIAAAEAEHDLMTGPIMLQATGGESPPDEWLPEATLAAEAARRMTRKDERLEPDIPPERSETARRLTPGR